MEVENIPIAYFLLGSEKREDTREKFQSKVSFLLLVS